MRLQSTSMCQTTMRGGAYECSAERQQTKQARLLARAYLLLEKNGITQAGYCEANGLSCPTFGYWRRKSLFFRIVAAFFSSKNSNSETVPFAFQGVASSIGNIKGKMNAPLCSAPLTSPMLPADRVTSDDFSIKIILIFT